MIHGTTTGRLSCGGKKQSKNSPQNLQNIPSPKKDNPEENRTYGKDFRSCFIAPEGSLFLSRDYRNFEVFLLAYITGDKNLIHTVENSNIHDENTKLLFGIFETDPTWEMLRAAAKAYQFGRLQYGGGDRKMYTDLLTEIPNLKMAFAEYKQLAEKYFASHPEQLAWYEKVEEIAVEGRYVETPFGRRRELYGRRNDRKKEAKNTPIQGSAAHIINRAWIRIQNRLEKENLKSGIILQIHDELIFECPKDEIEIISKLSKEEMERPVKINNKMISFPTDCKIGPSWGELEKY